MSENARSVLGYPSVRRVVDSIFGQSTEPLSFVDALSGSFALFLFAFLCFIALRHGFWEMRRKYGWAAKSNRVRKVAKKGARAANDAAPKGTRVPAKKRK